MKTIKENVALLKKLTHTELCEALIYKELEGWEDTVANNDEELAVFIRNLANKWTNDYETHLLPENIFNEIF